GLAPPFRVPRRGPGAVLPDRKHRSGHPADRGGQAGVPEVRRARAVLGVGTRGRPGPRRVGRSQRGRTSGAQAPQRPRAGAYGGL
ncbi:MAG: WhiB-like transcription regulator, partial [uncultured Nocardioidaceae bacterium]